MIWGEFEDNVTEAELRSFVALAETSGDPVHERTRIGLEIGQAPAVLRVHDQPEMMPVGIAPPGEASRACRSAVRNGTQTRVC